MIHICFDKNIIHHIHMHCPYDKVVYFPLKLSIGTIPRTSFIEEIEIYQRKKEDIEKELFNYYQMINKNDIYSIWYSYESDEYCGFLYVLFDILKFSNNIFLYNCSQKIRRKHSEIIYDSSNEIPEDIFLWILNHPQRLNDFSLETLYSAYNKLFDERYNLRRYDHGLQLTTIDEIEKLIINYLKNKSLSINSLEMELIVEQKLNISERIIIYIINKLVQQNVIQKLEHISLYDSILYINE